MAQNTILAAGTTAAVSSDVVIAAGNRVTVGAFVSSGNIPSGVQLNLVIDTPGVDVTIGKLSAATPVVLVNGPATLRVIRPNIASFDVSVGAFTEDA